VDYAGDKAPDGTPLDGMEGMDITPLKSKTLRKAKNPDESDTDFLADSDADAETGADEGKDSDDYGSVVLGKDDFGLAIGTSAKLVAGRKKSTGKLKLSPSSTTKKGAVANTPTGTPKAKVSVAAGTGAEKVTPRKGGLTITITPRKSPAKALSVKPSTPKVLVKKVTGGAKVAKPVKPAAKNKQVEAKAAEAIAANAKERANGAPPPVAKGPPVVIDLDDVEVVGFGTPAPATVPLASTPAPTSGPAVNGAPPPVRGGRLV
jgi:hypothetical protein